MFFLIFYKCEHNCWKCRRNKKTIRLTAGNKIHSWSLDIISHYTRKYISIIFLWRMSCMYCLTNSQGIFRSNCRKMYIETSGKLPGSSYKYLNGLERDSANSCKIGPPFWLLNTTAHINRYLRKSMNFWLQRESPQRRTCLCMPVSFIIQASSVVKWYAELGKKPLACLTMAILWTLLRENKI